MPFRSRFIFAPMLVLLLTGSTIFAAPDLPPLFSNVDILGSSPDLIAELKITPEQEKSLKASQERRSQIHKQAFAECMKVATSKLTKSEKAIKINEMQTQEANDTFRVYAETLRPEQIKRLKQILLQRLGVRIFYYPEIQATLKLSDAEAKAIQEASLKSARETAAKLSADLKAKKITPTELMRKSSTMGRSIPDKVLELLNKDQKKALEDLLGTAFYSSSEK